MRRSRALAAAAAVVVTGTMVLTLSPSQGSDAQWRETATAPATGPMSGAFNMTATDVPFQAPPWTGSGRVSNSPRIDVTNESARHSSWANVHSTSVKRAVSPDSNNILSQVTLDYEYGDGKCELTLGDYWKPGVPRPIVENTTYPRTPQAKVAIATLSPGQKKSLCPAVRLNYDTSTDAGQRDALLNHAGRALDITTVLNQKSESPATWASEASTVTSRYRIAIPTPMKPSGSPVCRNTNSSGHPDGVIQAYGGFFWGWPDASTSTDKTTTPAMAGGWEVLRQSATGSWEVFADAQSNKRQRAGINSRDIFAPGPRNNNTRKFKLRGYPFAGDKTRYVESAWIAKAHHAGGLSGAWYCDDPETNPDAGPHNMP